MKRMASASLSAAMMMTAAAPVVTSLPVMAASSANTNNNTADTKDLAHADVIDMSKTGSITVHKYDITSAEAAGAYTMGQYKATGQTDMRVENALSKYAIQGVQFTYLRLGNVEQYSNTTADGSQLKVVYEIPTALADILKLSEADATVMTGDGISTPCTNTGVLHYTSTQINDALDAILKADDVAAKNALESYLLDYATQSTDGDDKQAADTGVLETDANGIASKDKLALGLYLMVETNACPCGYYPMDKCRCTSRQILRYQNRISGPILDRMDLFVRCEEIGYDVLTASSKEESSSSIQKRVSAAWVIQKERFAESSTIFNGRMTKSEVEQYCQLDAEGQRLMKKAYSAFSLTGRSYFKILKTARTIADLEQSPDIRARHLEEALYFRQKEKGNLNER